MSKQIRVLVADDHLVVREGLRLILEENDDFLLVGSAIDGADAIRLTDELQPQVVLMDLRMPGVDGLQAIEHIHKRWPEVSVVILTTYNDDDLMLRGLKAGACGYLVKDTDRETLFHAIRAAARNETLLLPEQRARLLAYACSTSANSRAIGSQELTERELAVLAGVARGQRNKEIASCLGISEPTVKSHLASIYFKLGVDSRASAVSVAFERKKLLPPLDVQVAPRW